MHFTFTLLLLHSRVISVLHFILCFVSLFVCLFLFLLAVLVSCTFPVVLLFSVVVLCVFFFLVAVKLLISRICVAVSRRHYYDCPFSISIAKNCTSLLQFRV